MGCTMLKRLRWSITHLQPPVNRVATQQPFPAPDPENLQGRLCVGIFSGLGRKCGPNDRVWNGMSRLASMLWLNHPANPRSTSPLATRI